MTLGGSNSIPAPAPISAAAQAVIGLTDNQCRFPLGDIRSADFRFCCAAIAGADCHTRSYCAEHALAVTNRGLPREFSWRPHRV